MLMLFFLDVNIADAKMLLKIAPTASRLSNILTGTLCLDSNKKSEIVLRF